MQKVVGDPADARLGLTVSQSTSTMITRAWAYHVGLIKDGGVIDCNVSFYELSTTRTPGLPMAMLYPCTIHDYNT